MTKDLEDIVEIELPDELFIKLALEAHEADRTLNEHINKVLIELLSKSKEYKDSVYRDDHFVDQP